MHMLKISIILKKRIKMFPIFYALSDTLDFPDMSTNMIDRLDKDTATVNYILVLL